MNGGNIFRAIQACKSSFRRNSPAGECLNALFRHETPVLQKELLLLPGKRCYFGNSYIISLRCEALKHISAVLKYQHISIDMRLMFVLSQQFTSNRRRKEGRAEKPERARTYMPSSMANIPVVRSKKKNE